MAATIQKDSCEFGPQVKFTKHSLNQRLSQFSQPRMPCEMPSPRCYPARAWDFTSWSIWIEAAGCQNKSANYRGSKAPGHQMKLFWQNKSSVKSPLALSRFPALPHATKCCLLTAHTEAQRHYQESWTAANLPHLASHKWATGAWALSSTGWTVPERWRWWAAGWGPAIRLQEWKLVDS